MILQSSTVVHSSQCRIRLHTRCWHQAQQLISKSVDRSTTTSRSNCDYRLQSLLVSTTHWQSLTGLDLSSKSKLVVRVGRQPSRSNFDDLLQLLPLNLLILLAASLTTLLISSQKRLLITLLKSFLLVLFVVSLTMLLVSPQGMLAAMLLITAY